MVSQSELAGLIDAVERELASQSRRLRFEPALERQYEQHKYESRMKSFRIGCLIGLALFDAFLFNDLSLVRDVFWVAVVCRLLVFTPVTLFLISQAPRIPCRTADLLSAMSAIVAAAIIMLLYDLSNSRYGMTYHYGTVLVVTFSIILQRIRFGLSVVIAVGVGALYVGGLYLSPHFNPQLFQTDCACFVTGAILVLVASYGLEREHRRGFLLTLRVRYDMELLERLATTDPLTGLFNRRRLSDMMQAAVRQEMDAGTAWSAVLVDIDHFKQFNDTLGHPAGDECLRRVGACMAAAAQPFDGIAIRYGGEEFLILLQETAPRQALQAAEIARAKLGEARIAFPHRGPDAVVTCSIGIATACLAESGLKQIVSLADDALYAAKRAGRDCIRVATAGDRPRPDAPDRGRLAARTVPPVFADGTGPGLKPAPLQA